MPAAIADDPQVRIRGIAAHCRLTERAVQRIIADLELEGYLSHTREGRTSGVDGAPPDGSRSRGR